MKRYYYQFVWFAYWLWRTPRNRAESERKIFIACCRKPPYAHEELMARYYPKRNPAVQK